ncbi:MAG: hypothetical protein FJX97_00115 [Bacteroidetes bacterium]|nr:hypothetical protein [Bacteroidota bacterium]
MKNLVTYIGNSSIKSALFAGNEVQGEAVEVDLNQGIANYFKKFPEISIYLGGRNAESFDSFAKDHIFVVPNLVLFGLNCILNHHVA